MAPTSGGHEMHLETQASSSLAASLASAFRSAFHELQRLGSVKKLEGLRPYETEFDFLNKIPDMSSPEGERTLSDIARAVNEQQIDQQKIVEGLQRFCFLMRVVIFEVSQTREVRPTDLAPNLILGSLFGSQGTTKPCQDLASAADCFRKGEVSSGLRFLTLVREITEEVLSHRDRWDEFGRSPVEAHEVERLSEDLDGLRGSISFSKLKVWMLGKDPSLSKAKRWRLLQTMVRSRRPVRGSSPSCEGNSRSVTLLNSIREVRGFETRERMCPIIIDEEFSRQDVQALVPWWRAGKDGEIYCCDGDRSWTVMISHENIVSTDRRDCYKPADIGDAEKKALTTWIRFKVAELRECPFNISAGALCELGDLAENGGAKLADSLQTWQLGESIISNTKLHPSVIVDEMSEKLYELWPCLSHELWCLRDSMGPRSLTQGLDLATTPAKWVRWFVARTVAPIDNAYLICNVAEGVHVELSTTTGPQKNPRDVGYDNLNGSVSVSNAANGFWSSVVILSWDTLLHHLNQAQMEPDRLRRMARGIDVLRQRLTLGRPSVKLISPSDISARTDSVLHSTEIEEVESDLQIYHELYDKRNQENG